MEWLYLRHDGEADLLGENLGSSKWYNLFICTFLKFLLVFTLPIAYYYNAWYIYWRQSCHVLCGRKYASAIFFFNIFKIGCYFWFTISNILLIFFFVFRLRGKQEHLKRQRICLKRKLRNSHTVSSWRNVWGYLPQKHHSNRSYLNKIYNV